MNGDRNWKRVWTGALLSVLCGFLAPANTAAAAPAAWVDEMSGYAIAGYDPVAFHARRKAVSGEAGIEVRWAGAAWRFENTGNRDAFTRHPQIYAPKFAGYDAEALARGLTVQGNPQIFALYADRVFFFRDRASLNLWRSDAARLTASAEANWKALARELPGTSRN